MSTQTTDIVIVGSGIGGLCAAKTFRELAPETKLLILEARATLGGVWSGENLYEGLKTNNLVGTYEFSDFPLLGKYGVAENEHIPGRIMHEYLNDYAKHFKIFDLIQFQTKVTEVEKLGSSGWRITARTSGSNDVEVEQTFKCKKLIMCNGLASTPRPVDLPGQECFDKPLFNHSGLKDQAQKVALDPNVTAVTVIGASKIGYDAVYLFASHGKKVDWIIRQSGGGAVWMSTPWIPLGPWTVMLEHVVTTRFFTWFSPCIWGAFDGFGWIRRVLHGTSLGRWLVHQFWEKQRADIIDGNGYRKDQSIRHLEPLESLFWNARVGIHNYPSDIHGFVRSGQVTIRRKDISHLGEDGLVSFRNGTSNHTDALIAITGWQLVPSIKYKPEGIDAQIGVPSSTYNAKQTALWDKLDSQADEEILSRFPYLRNPPEAKLPFTQTVTPFRLYRGIAAPALTAEKDHSLAFMKMVHCTSNLILAETQALWIFAYFNDYLPIERDNVLWSTALTSRFGKHRYPWGFSAWWPEFVYDAVPYADMLLTDLGIRRWRKPTWKKEIFEGYTIHDYKGINEEWLKGRRSRVNDANDSRSGSSKYS